MLDEISQMYFSLQSAFCNQQTHDSLWLSFLYIDVCSKENKHNISYYTSHKGCRYIDIGFFVQEQPQSAGNHDIFSSFFSLCLYFSACTFTSLHFHHSSHSLVCPPIAVILMSGPQGPAGVSVVQQCYSKPLLQHPKHVFTFSLSPPSV